jgi:hypothetical protein
MVDATPNAAPLSASATITAVRDTVSSGVFPAVNDPDRGDTHTISIASQPANGTASVTNNRLVYMPNAGFLGSDSFTFVARDLGGLSVTGTADVTVVVPVITNEAPTSAQAVIQTVQGQTSSGVTPVVSDPDSGDNHFFTISVQPANGIAQVVNGQLVYTPSGNFTGSDNFTFIAEDLGGLSVAGTANVTVTEPGSGSTGGGSTGQGGGGGAMGIPESFGFLLALWFIRLSRREMLIPDNS